MSENVERRLIEMLGEPTESPYGNPIPAMEEIGGAKSEDFLAGVIRVTDAVSDQTTSGILRRIGEPAQFDPELLKRLKNAGLIPGARVSVSKDTNGYRVEAAAMNGAVVVSAEIAHHLYLAA
jgi:DtxR family Mn-dependent transcriptional regulator